MSISVQDSEASTPLNYRTSRFRGTTISGSRLSTRNLDLCLLAVCSCAMTLLCHQVVNLSYPTVTSSQSAVQSTPFSTLARLDFNIKSALLTSSQTEEPSEPD